MPAQTVLEKRFKSHLRNGKRRRIRGGPISFRVPEEIEEDRIRHKVLTARMPDFNNRLKPLVFKPGKWAPTLPRILST
jgi:hypothetical protein